MALSISYTAPVNLVTDSKSSTCQSQRDTNVIGCAGCSLHHSSKDAFPCGNREFLLSSGRKRSPTPTSGAPAAAGTKRKAEGSQPSAKRKRSATPPVPATVRSGSSCVLEHTASITFACSLFLCQTLQLMLALPGSSQHANHKLRLHLAEPPLNSQPLLYYLYATNRMPRHHYLASLTICNCRSRQNCCHPVVLYCRQKQTQSQHQPVQSSLSQRLLPSKQSQTWCLCKR